MLRAIKQFFLEVVADFVADHWKQILAQLIAVVLAEIVNLNFYPSLDTLVKPYSELMSAIFSFDAIFSVFGYICWGLSFLDKAFNNK